MRWPSSRTTWEPEEILAYPARLLLSLQSFHILLLMADDLSRWKSATLHRIEGMQVRTQSVEGCAPSTNNQECEVRDARINTTVLVCGTSHVLSCYYSPRRLDAG